MKRLGIIGMGSLGTCLSNMVINRQNKKQIASNQHYNKYDIIGSNQSGKTKSDHDDVVLYKSDMNEMIARRSDVIILSVKPSMLMKVCEQIKDAVSEDTVIISTAAAVSLPKLSSYLPKSKIIIRCMPNIPCCIGSGVVTYISDHPFASYIMYDIFHPNMIIKMKSDEEIDISTILTGSFPAFLSWYLDTVNEFTDNMDDQIKRKILTKTMIGTARLLDNGLTTSDIINAVSSPGGTTEATLRALELNRTNESIKAALRTARDRITALSKE